MGGEGCQREGASLGDAVGYCCKRKFGSESVSHSPLLRLTCSFYTFVGTPISRKRIKVDGADSPFAAKSTLKNCCTDRCKRYRGKGHVGHMSASKPPNSRGDVSHTSTCGKLLGRGVLLGSPGGLWLVCWGLLVSWRSSWSSWWSWWSSWWSWCSILFGGSPLKNFLDIIPYPCCAHLASPAPQTANPIYLKLAHKESEQKQAFRAPGYKKFAAQALPPLF